MGPGPDGYEYVYVTVSDWGIQGGNSGGRR